MSNTHFLSKDNASSIVGAVADRINGIESAVSNVYGAKNLIRNIMNTYTTLGVTFTVNSDGSVYASGTATSGIYLSYASFNLPAGNYIYSGSPANSSHSSHLSYVHVGSADYYDLGSGVSFSLASDSTIQIILCYKSGAVADDTFYPMIRDARIKDSTFVPIAKTNAQLTDGNDILKPEYVSDANTLTTNGKVTISYYNDDTLNTPFKQGISGVGLGSIITYRNGDGEWIGQIALPVASTEIYVRGRVSSYYGSTWHPWYKTASLDSSNIFNTLVKAMGSTAYTTAHIVNTVATDVEPTAGASTDLPNGTQILVYE